MQINIKATGLELTAEIDNYVNSKLNFLQKFLRDDQEAHCQVEVARTTFHHRKGQVFRAEVNLQVKGENLYAAAEKDDLYAALDEVKDEIKQKFLSQKNKRETLFKRGGRRLKAALKNLWPGRWS